MIYPKRRHTGLGVGLILVFSGCFGDCGSGSKSAGQDTEYTDGDGWFQEVAATAGVDFVHVRARTIRYWFPEIMSGGACWLIYDSDEHLDLYLVQGGDLDGDDPARPGNHLFRNRGDGRFEDVTQAAGVGDQSYGMGCATGDYDGDGDVDLYVTNVGPNVLYRNDGDGTFTDVTAQAGVGHDGWSTSAAFTDYDGDGHLDLFVVNYIHWSPDQEIECSSAGLGRGYCHPQNYLAPATDLLYHNNGDGTFTDVTVAAGIVQAIGNGLGITTGDFDGDGQVDLYVANDGNPNQLWINQGDGTFVDRGLVSGSAVNRHGMPEAGMGVAAIDIENDGDLDLFMTHLRDETNTLYRNDGGFFEDATITAGLAAPSIRYTGFGVGFADFDHDGEQDLYVANGRVGRTRTTAGDPFTEPNQLFRGVGGGQFEEIHPQGGTAPALVATSRAAALGDYDGDGDIDVVVVNNGGPLHLLRNRMGEQGRWVMFRIVNRAGRDAIDARVGIRVGGQDQWRLVQPAASYQAAHDMRVHFGLGATEQVDEVEVFWPGGRREAFGPFAEGAVYELREGARRAGPSEASR